MKAKEPVPVYYTPQMIHAVTNNLQRRLAKGVKPEVLAEMDRLVADGEETFAEKYVRAKELAYRFFDEETARQLESQDFLIGKPLPEALVEGEASLDALFKEGDEGMDTISDDVVRKWSKAWKDALSAGA